MDPARVFHGELEPRVTRVVLDNFAISPLHPRFPSNCCVTANRRVVPKPEVTSSLDHLVGAQQHSLRKLQAERLCGPQVNHEFENCRPLDRQFARLGPAGNAVEIIGDAPRHHGPLGEVTTEPGDLDQVSGIALFVGVAFGLYPS